jgi:calcium/calmodulin-dependent protein kinase I
MQHRKILTLVDYFETLNNVYLIFNLTLSGNLYDRVHGRERYHETDAADLTRALVSGIAYLHSNEIVHGSMKPENLLFRTPEEKSDLLIAELGFCKDLDVNVDSSACGERYPTPDAFGAPETVGDPRRGKPVDIWAIGVLTYFMLCGYLPFDRDSDLEKMQAIRAADYSFTPIEYWRDVSADARDFITSCLKVNPRKGITAQTALNHPFLTTERKSVLEPGPVQSSQDVGS